MTTNCQEREFAEADEYSVIRGQMKLFLDLWLA